VRKAFALAFGMALMASAFSVIPAQAGAPPWIAHVQNYPGGISGGPRARLAATEVATVTTDSTLSAGPPDR